MKHTLYAVLAACLAMLATSGIVALATAASTTPAPELPEITASTDMEAWLSEAIDVQYRQAIARQANP